MDPYIEKWFRIIERMQNSNTYKLAWGRSILEIAVTKEYELEDNHAVITFEKIAAKMLKYYWNQTYFFNLAQGPRSQTPTVMRYVQTAISKYQELTNSTLPVWYNHGEIILKRNLNTYDRLINIISTILPTNVAHRFLNVGAEKVDVYQLEMHGQHKRVIIQKEQIDALGDYGAILIAVINYKWSQLLETYNRCPRVASKVHGSQMQAIKRASLNKYKEKLLYLFDNNHIIDFYTGAELAIEDTSIDHVIPWSFMYSDDLWNLVITSKRNNSIKSNSIPDEDTIQKLKLRNELLYSVLKTKGEDCSYLEEAIEHDYVDKYYQDCRL